MQTIWKSFQSLTAAFFTLYSRNTARFYEDAIDALMLFFQVTLISSPKLKAVILVTELHTGLSMPVRRIKTHQDKISL